MLPLASTRCLATTMDAQKSVGGLPTRWPPVVDQAVQGVVPAASGLSEHSPDGDAGGAVEDGSVSADDEKRPWLVEGHGDLRSGIACGLEAGKCEQAPGLYPW